MQRLTPLFFGLFCLLSAPAFSQDSTDSSRLPIDVEADHGTYDQLAGLAIYTGNVKIRQGASTIWAHKLTIVLKNNTAERLEAEGNQKAPVRFEYQGDKQPISGKGQSAVYHVPKKTVTLSGQAEVQQGTDIVKGNKLTYNLGKEIIEGSRVKMTFLPKN